MSVRTHREIQIILVGLMLGMLLPAMTMTIVATALPTIVSDLGGLSDLSWVVTAYLLAATVCVPLVGKASDLLGRKPLFELAIVVFVVGSVLCGLAQSMGQLIAARAVQGMAGGSLMALAHATIGDVVPPRQRGRYQGYVGAVFAVATLAGPLVGGFLVDFLSWRWVFHLNVPLGLVALAVTHRYLRIVHERRSVTVDYLGAALVSAGVTALLLVGLWGGQQHAWNSPVILGLTAVAVSCSVLLVPVERRAAEPIVPLRLFSEQVFRVGSLLSFVLGTVLFGAIVFTPTFLQVVIGVSATASGLMLLPLMGGLLVASIVSGRLITRWGRYKPFPVAGTGLLLVGFGLLATMSATSTLAEASLYLAIVGVGMGLTMQVVILAIQNAVPTHDLGAATSAAQLFRMIGGTLGLAAFGAVVNLRLANWVARRLPDGLPGGVGVGGGGIAPAANAPLPAPAEAVVRHGMADAITFAFLLAVPILVVAFAAAVALRELPLREHNADAAGPAGADTALPPLPARDQQPVPRRPIRKRT
jgi:EmrB/QacA subfamily drug resistance transporter